MNLWRKHLLQLMVCVGCLVLPDRLARQAGLSKATGVAPGPGRQRGAGTPLRVGPLSQHTVVPATALRALSAALLGLAGG
jgi:hypothetical protein